MNVKKHFIEWCLFDSGFSIVFFSKVHLDLVHSTCQHGCTQKHMHSYTHTTHTNTERGTDKQAYTHTHTHTDTNTHTHKGCGFKTSRLCVWFLPADAASVFFLCKTIHWSVSPPKFEPHIVYSSMALRRKPCKP